MSLSTLGAIDLRSDRERIARNTRNTAKAVKAQTSAIEAEHRRAAIADAHAFGAALLPSLPIANTITAAASPTAPTSLPPAGWIDDSEREGHVRWWDGSGWTEHRKAKE